MRYKIVHITVHLGGGIGSVLMNLVDADKDNDHQVICLNRNYYVDYDEDFVLVNMKHDWIKIRKYIAKSDIVVIHFWNHPFLFDFIINSDIPECRMIFWAHSSGLFPPYVHQMKVIEYSDRFLFSSPISYEAKEIKELPERLIERLGCIWTTGNIHKFKYIAKVDHDGFNICYVGTLDYAKLHPNFVEICKRIDLPDVKFLMIGEGADIDEIKKQVREHSLESKFVFTGIVNGVGRYFEISDVFGYPLNPNHFGTCEQVIGEALASGVVPVTLNNPAEKHIFSNSQINFVCNNEDEYIETIEAMYRNRHLLPRVVKNMQSEILPLYDSCRMINDWNLEFDNIMKINKRKRVWTLSVDRHEMGGAGVYFESLGDHSHVLENGTTEDIANLFAMNRQWSSKSKGSPSQYLDAFPNDKVLSRLVKIIDQGE